MRMSQTEMERRESTHRQSNNMRLWLADMIERSEDACGRAGLRIGGDVLRHIGWGKAPCIEGDGTITFPEMAHLLLVAAQIASEFMNQDQGTARSGFLEIQAHSVVPGGIGHVGLRPAIGLSLRLVGAARRPRPLQFAAASF